MSIDKTEGATDGGMGKHVETLSTAELVVFGKVYLRCKSSTWLLLILSPPGYLLEPISLYYCGLYYQDINSTILSKHICNTKVSCCHKYHRRYRASMDNHLLFCLLVPSLTDLEELVFRGVWYYDRRVLNVPCLGMHRTRARRNYPYFALDCHLELAHGPRSKMDGVGHLHSWRIVSVYDYRMPSKVLTWSKKRVSRKRFPYLLFPQHTHFSKSRFHLYVLLSLATLEW